MDWGRWPTPAWVYTGPQIEVSPVPRIILPYGNILCIPYVRRYNDSRIQRSEDREEPVGAGLPWVLGSETLLDH